MKGKVVENSGHEPDIERIVARFFAERPLLLSWCDYIVTILNYDPAISALAPILLKGRVKGEESLRDKIKDKHGAERMITATTLFHEIEDLAGARLVVAQKRHVPLVIERIHAHQKIGTWQIDDEKHYVWHPGEALEVEMSGLEPERKEFAYCSRHFILSRPGTGYDSEHIIKCELQVRTILEEAMFENDHRIRYKKKHTEHTAKVLSRLSEMLQSADQLLADAYDLAEWERRDGV